MKYLGWILGWVMLGQTVSAQVVIQSWDFNDGTPQGWTLNVQENGATNPAAAAHRFVVSNDYESCQADFPGQGMVTEAAAPNQPTDACAGFVGPQPNHHNLRVTTVRGIETSPPCLLPAVCAVDVTACGGLNACCNGSLDNEILFAKSPAFSTAGHTGVRLEFSWHMNGGYWPPTENPLIGSIPEVLLAGEVYYSYDGTNWTLLQAATLGGGGGAQGRLYDQNAWFRGYAADAALDNRPVLYLGFRHVIRGLHAPWNLLGFSSGQMNYSVTQDIVNSISVAEPGLAIDDIVVYVPGNAQVALQCPSTFTVSAGQNFGLPITVTGAVGAASVNWDINGAAGSNPNVHTYPFLIQHNFAAPGIYNYTVSICADGQTRTCSGTITATACAGDIVITPTSITAPTGCEPTGSAYFEITPMLSDGQPYQLILTPETGTLSPGTGFSDLSAGSYTLTAVDPAGCTANYEFVLVVSEPVDSLAAIPAGCSAGGSVYVRLKDCVEPPFVYRLFSGATAVAQLDSDQRFVTFNDVPFGNYIVRVDYMGTTYTTGTISVIGGGDLNLAVTGVNQPSHCAASDGSMDVQAVGGTPPYTLHIADGSSFTFEQSTTRIGNLAPGVYAVHLTDAEGCQSASQNVVLVAPVTFSVEITATNETAAGAQDGTLTVGLAGGTMPTTDLTLQIDGPYTGEITVPVGTGPLPFTLGELAPGTYVVRVFDGNGCAAGGTPDTLQIEPGPLSRHFLSQNRFFTLFPNPARETVILRFNEAFHGRYELWDAAGKLVLNGEIRSQEMTLAVEKLSSGPYYLQVTDGKHTAGAALQIR